MMGTPSFFGLILTAAAAALGPSSGPTWSAPPDPATARPLMLLGCVQPDRSRPERFTLADRSGTTYHLTGASVKAYVWRHVRIVGGLVPSATLAAQAGAVDQTKAAMAYQGGNLPGTGNIGPPEFSVTRVQRVTGSCAPKSDR
jgi:hypothetical protein